MNNVVKIKIDYFDHNKNNKQSCKKKFKCCKLTLWRSKIKRNKNTRRQIYCMAVDRRKCLRQKFISKTFKVVISKTSYAIMNYEILAQILLRPLPSFT